MRDFLLFLIKKITGESVEDEIYEVINAYFVFSIPRNAWLEVSLENSPI